LTALFYQKIRTVIRTVKPSFSTGAALCPEKGTEKPLSPGKKIKNPLEKGIRRGEPEVRLVVRRLAFR
jgi:hypothetical protein